MDVTSHVGGSAHLVLRRHSVAPETFVGTIAVGTNTGCTVCKPPSCGRHERSTGQCTFVALENRSKVLDKVQRRGESWVSVCVTPKGRWWSASDRGWMKNREVGAPVVVEDEWGTMGAPVYARNENKIFTAYRGSSQAQRTLMGKEYVHSISNDGSGDSPGQEPAGYDCGALSLE